MVFQSLCFPLEPVWVYYVPPDFFDRARLSFAPVTTGSLTLLLTALYPVTLRRFFSTMQPPVGASLQKLQRALSILSELEADICREGVNPVISQLHLTYSLSNTLSRQRSSLYVT